MAQFAYVVHPHDASRVVGKYPILRRLPTAWVEAGMGMCRPSQLGRIDLPYPGVGPGWIVECPLTTRRLAELSPHAVASRLIRTCLLARKLGAEVVGVSHRLAGVGGGSDLLSTRTGISITTGRALQVAAALEALRVAVARTGLDLAAARVLVVGAASPVGAACARILARDVRLLALTDSDRPRVEALAGRILREHGLSPRWSSALVPMITGADALVIAAPGALTAAASAQIKPGAVVCLAAGTDDQMHALAARRDITFIGDALVRVPSRPDLGPAGRLGRGVAPVALAEAMILAWEGLVPSGSQPSLREIENMAALARGHGFGVVA